MDVAVLDFHDPSNLGDNIQSLAVAQHFDQKYSLVERDHLSEYNGDPVAVVMNGWFTHKPQNWPPSDKITPIFFGFHLTPSAAHLLEKHKNYFKKYEPVGCRDIATATTLISWGINAYVTGCATLTFPTREKNPENPKVFLVDQTHRHFLREERENFIRISHEFPNYFSSEVKFKAARDILKLYREKAELVITSRIHCALPCAAMGIPVVYTGVRDGRTEITNTVNIPYFKTRKFPRTKMAHLPVHTPSFEKMKTQAMNDLHARLAAHGIKLKKQQTAA